MSAVIAPNASARTREPPLYSTALETVRAATLSGKDVGVVALLVRATAISSAAVESLVKMPLKTRAQRREGIVAAAVAITGEEDFTHEARDPDALDADDDHHDQHQRDDRGDQNLAAMIELCRKNPQHLSEWERRFVGSLPDARRLSKKQARVLRQIVAAVRQGRRPQRRRAA